MTPDQEAYLTEENEDKKAVLNIFKIGGKLIDDELQLQFFLSEFSRKKGPKILVHGGGILATRLSEKLGYETFMREGRRITDEKTMEVITMTYAGLINKQLVAALQGSACKAIGLCGADAAAIISVKRAADPVDFGFVGDVVEVNTPFINSLLQQDISPVFSAVSCTREGTLLNTNADSIAAEIAKAFAPSYEIRLYYCMEKQGVLLEVHDENSLIPHLDQNRYLALVEEGRIADGMLPKLHNCFEALNAGVSEIYIGNTTLIENNTTGTKITK